MTRATLDQLAQERQQAMPLPAEDWDAILAQAERLVEAIEQLDELPLDQVEPAAVYRLPS